MHRDTLPKYERSIVRNTSNVEEANALTIAENSNYSEIFNLQRFTTSNHYETWAYTWANFIDTQVIEYYDNRFENLKPEDIKFHYEANVSTWDQVRVVYDDAMQVLSRNGSVLWKNSHWWDTSLMKFAYRNDSEYQEITAEEINFSLSKSYVIEMTLDYDEIWGPLSGSFTWVSQIIIVDQDLEPLLLCIQSIQAIS